MTTTATKVPARADLIDDIDLKHKDGCSNPFQIVRMGRLGDTLLSCRDCAAFRVVSPWMFIDPAKVMQAPPESPRPAQKPQNRPPAPSSSWRCATHLDEPVSWRGTGCKACKRAAKA